MSDAPHLDHVRQAKRMAADTPFPAIEVADGHAHVVWSRIDGDEMKAINLPHFKTKLRDLSRDLFLDHGWVLPDDLATYGNKSPLNFTLEEWQQAKRQSIDPPCFGQITVNMAPIYELVADAPTQAQGVNVIKAFANGTLSISSVFSANNIPAGHGFFNQRASPGFNPQPLAAWTGPLGSRCRYPRQCSFEWTGGSLPLSTSGRLS